MLSKSKKISDSTIKAKVKVEFEVEAVDGQIKSESTVEQEENQQTVKDDNVRKRKKVNIQVTYSW